MANDLIGDAGVSAMSGRMDAKYGSRGWSWHLRDLDRRVSGDEEMLRVRASAVIHRGRRDFEIGRAMGEARINGDADVARDRAAHEAISRIANRWIRAREADDVGFWAYTANLWRRAPGGAHTGAIIGGLFCASPLSLPLLLCWQLG